MGQSCPIAILHYEAYEGVVGNFYIRSASTKSTILTSFTAWSAQKYTAYFPMILTWQGLPVVSGYE